MLMRLRKLRRMSVAEIRSRCRDRVVQQRERHTWRRGTATRFPSLAAVPLLSNAARLVPGALGEERKRLETGHSELAASLINRAADRATEICDSEVQLLGFPYKLQLPIDWQKDPRSDYRWPRGFYADLPLYNLPAGVDVKYVWELGRHQFLADLARAWWATKNEAYASKTRDVLIDWIRNNPVYEGVHWTSGLEAAMRSISWIWSLAFLSEWKGWKNEDLETVGRSLVDHATFLRSHFSFYSSPFNHLIGEASALFLLSQLLSNFRDAPSWESESLAVLETHGPRQFYDDGFCVEQATGYHFYTLAFLTLTLSAARINSVQLSNVEKTVQNAFVAGIALRQPDGRWPTIGDLDSARAIPVLHDDFWNFDSLCSVGAVLFNDPRLKCGADPGQELFELSGTHGISQWLELSSKPQPRTKYLPESGYFVTSTAQDWLLIDVGPVAGGLYSDSTPSAAHGHADTLQLLYNHDGKPILIDPGIPFYGGEREWVEHFRSAAAHNTIVVDGVGPVKPAGRLAWSNAMSPPQFWKQVEQQFALAIAEVDWGPVRVKRHVLYLNDVGVYVADIIRSDKTRLVSWHWHFPGLSAVSAQKEWQVGAVTIRCGALNSKQLDTDVRVGEGRNPVGWMAANYGILETAVRLSISMDAVPDAVLLTSITHGVASVSFVNKDGRVSCGKTPSTEARRIQIDNSSWWEVDEIAG